MWNEAEVEAELERRLKKQKEVVADAVESLRPELREMSERIQDSNHVKAELKEEFGSQLRQTNLSLKTLTDEVRATNSRLEAHAGQRTHAGVASLITEFGVDNMSLEQKQALAGVLGAAVRDGQGAARRAAWIGFSTQVVSAVAGAVVALAAVLALMANGTIQVHHP